METAWRSPSEPSVAAPLPNFATWETTPKQRRIAAAISALMIAIGCAAVVFGRHPGPVVTALLPMLVGCIIITELLSAYVLLTQFLELRYPALVLIGAAYLYSGLLVIPYILTFPGVFSPTGLFNANQQTALMLWALWHAGFPILVLAYAAGENRFRGVRLTARHARAITVTCVVSCLMIAAIALFLTTHFRDSLPRFMVDGRFSRLSLTALLPAISFFDLAALVVLVAGMRGRTVAPMWLTLAVLASLLDSIIGVVCQRYSFGWYTGKGFAVASSSLILGAFVYESLGLNSKLANAHNELERLHAGERKRSQERLEYLAHHDALTGLDNRERLQQQLVTDISAARRSGNLLALLFLDLDHFKEVNDTLGQSAGDEVLIEAARRLRAVVRAEEFVARMGGDEFATVLKDITSPSEAESVAARFRNSLSHPFSVGDRTFHLSASVGIVIYPNDGTAPEELLSRADAAAHLAKRDGGDSQQFFSHEIAEQLRLRRTIHEGLRRALDQGEFILHYQPLLDLHSGEIQSAEALIRWQDPKNGMVPPSSFIPIAEDTGLMVPIGQWVLDTALRQAHRWRLESKPIRVAVNVSARQFQEISFFQRLCESLTGAHVDPHMLDLEVTESVAMADLDENATLQRCKELGVRLSLDDFGTHYSSLAYLRRLPVDCIKIDRSFIQGIPFNREDSAVVEAIITLGRSLGREIVAEGVESVAQLRWLGDHGADVAQGYLIAKPMPANAWDEWLIEWHSKKTALLGQALALS